MDGGVATDGGKDERDKQGKDEEKDVEKEEVDDEEEQGRNEEFTTLVENEEKILEMYKDFVETQLETQRKEEMKKNAQEVLKKLQNDR
mmetsp:Transcript_33265/g.38191  ORF Transcript_33265/g.38191 Transcript_33265/m.38191 type:complete len:88 (+) Transcript_33265:1-264(+)